jgi:hypothetical protein
VQPATLVCSPCSFTPESERTDRLMNDAARIFDMAGQSRSLIKSGPAKAAGATWDTSRGFAHVVSTKWSERATRGQLTLQSRVLVGFRMSDRCDPCQLPLQFFRPSLVPGRRSMDRASISFGPVNQTRSTARIGNFGRYSGRCRKRG